nr:hypothetical protein [Micromonospora echinofusca]
MARATASSSVREAVHGDDRAEGLLGVHPHAGSDAGEHGRFEDVRADVAAVPAAGVQGGAPLDGVGHVRGDGVELPRGGQRAEVGLEVAADAQPQRRGARDEAAQELVVQRVGDVDAFGGDAELAGAGEAGPDRALDRPVQVGVVEHEQRVLAAQLQRRRDQPARGLGGDLAADPGGTGEADEVGPLGDQRADVGPLAGDDLPERRGQPPPRRRGPAATAR